VATDDTLEPMMRPLWFCPRCGKPYAYRNSSHACVRIPLEAHFEGRPRARELFDAYRSAIDATGEAPVTVTVSKTRIEFVTRARFAGAIIHRDWVRAHFWLKRSVEDPRLEVEFLAPNNWICRFDLRDEAHVDDVLRGLLREARAVGDQRHPSQARYRARTAAQAG